MASRVTQSYMGQIRFPATVYATSGAMILTLHDTMTGEKRPFAPTDPKRVTMYVCGPTVYNYSHIGNFRPVVAFDLAGEEAGYPPADHWAAYQYAHNHFIRKTVHAGEAYGPESIWQAITQCHANRIGHGTFLFAHWPSAANLKAELSDALGGVAA